MTDLATLLAPGRLVDLTQPLGPGTALWPGSRTFSDTSVDGSGTSARVFAILPPDA